MRRIGVLAVAVALFGAGTACAESALQTLRTGDESRGWQAVGRIDFAGKSFCTGSMIADNLVLTAAHCLFDKETGQPYAAAEIRFLADWRNGRASAYRGVRRALAHPGFSFASTDRMTRVADDLALLELDQPVRNSTIVPFGTEAQPRRGAEVGVVSYARDRAESPSLQQVCHVLDEAGGVLVLSCDVDFGSSGSPVFMMENGVPRIVSVISAKAEADGKPVSLGTSLQGPLADLMAELGQGDGVLHSPSTKVRIMTMDEQHSSSGAKFLRP
jgi:protease YdgD